MLVDCLDAFAAMPGVTAAKRASFAMAGTGPGSSTLQDSCVLDVGCGTGTDLAPWGRVSGAEVVGADLSARMLSQARSRAPGHPLVQAHSHQLPFKDAAFAAVRSERLLLRDPDHGRSVAEMARVLRPGGQLVLVEPDLEEAVGTLRSAARADTRALLPWLRLCFAQPPIGGVLDRLLAAQGLGPCRIEIHREACDFPTADAVLQLHACALWARSSGVDPPGRLRRLLRELDDQGGASGPVRTVPIHVVAGTKPVA
ncbi:methyltransferase domain-containing protein [Streptomyces monticola]|uniref:Methyltransferase domain-containing protein n=1 Tax=Streptomyces monticola TaxID=2666263 RepID=A0ABW2JTE2_9ACTN